MADKITRFSVETRAENSLSFFYNPDNDLVVIDLVHKNERGGNEILRKTPERKQTGGALSKLSPD